MESLKKFFSIIADPNAYLSLVYQLFAFPLGLFYFVFLITGILVGIGLIIIWIGIPILLLMMLAWYGFSVFEKQLSIYVLKAEIPDIKKPENTKMSIWSQFKKYLSDPVTWKSLAFLFLRFPLGVLSFAITVSLMAVTVSFISAPFTYNYYYMEFGFFRVETLGLAILVAIAGILIGFLSLHVFKFMGLFYKRLSEVMLG
ncbi:MAG: sensor domain-containing protein [Bacteroidetes bacterium]|nr:sensor domain-containing protein [Bacteroidota bacterium]